MWQYVRSDSTNTILSSFLDENPYKVEGDQIKQRAKLLQKYLKDEQKELQALYALQALMVQLEQPASEWLIEAFRCTKCFYV